MASEKQIAANRLNAKKSTGPRTPAGKAISSRNALKTGEFAKDHAAIAIAEYKELAAEVMEEFQPQTAEARFHVRTLVNSMWQGCQLERMEDLMVANLTTRSDRKERFTITATRRINELNRVGRARALAESRFHRSLCHLLALREKQHHPEVATTSIAKQGK